MNERPYCFRHRTWVWAAGCIALAVLCIPWDIAISHQLRALRVPGDVRKAIQLSESAAHSIPCLFLFACLFWTDIKNRTKVLVGGGFVLTAGLVSNLAKGVVPRSRPYTLDDLTPALMPRSGAHVWGVPFTGSWFDESIRSFPSGHSATAIAVALALTYIYPRGKYFFFSIAILACFQRVECGAHYLSDVLFGVSIALLVGLFWWRQTEPLIGKSTDA